MATFATLSACIARGCVSQWLCWNCNAPHMTHTECHNHLTSLPMVKDQEFWPCATSGYSRAAYLCHSQNGWFSSGKSPYMLNMKQTLVADHELNDLQIYTPFVLLQMSVNLLHLDYLPQALLEPCACTMLQVGQMWQIVELLLTRHTTGIHCYMHAGLG